MMEHFNFSTILKVSKQCNFTYTQTLTKQELDMPKIRVTNNFV